MAGSASSTCTWITRLTACDRLRRSHDRPVRPLLSDALLEHSEHITTARTTDDDGAVLAIDERISDHDPETVEVTFHPQVWADGHAYTSDDIIQFTVPESDATDSAGVLLEDPCGASDPLKHHANAPPSVQHYPGPYYITLDRLDDTQ